jgi:outer membrane protein assembly factor BamB
MRTVNFLVYVLIFALSAGLANAGEWTTYQHDNERSGITSEELKTPLKEVWIYESRHSPQPAWSPPAKADYWHHLINPRARATYDRVYHVVCAEGLLYFGSSADDKVYCLDAATGEERWSFFTEGPVRLAPTVWNGRIYFGSDDGRVYCVNAHNGKLIWKYKAAEDRKIAGNGRIISNCPVRSGVAIYEGIAYFTVGMFPKEGVYVCALDALEGTEIWKKKHDISPQGNMLVSESRLYIPMGRVAPAVVSRNDGELMGVLNTPRAEGGTYAILAGSALISGPGTQLAVFHAEEQDQIATFSGYRVIVDDNFAYLLSEQELSAIDRSMKATLIEQYNYFEDTKEMLADKLAELRAERDKMSGDALKNLDSQMDAIVKEMSDLDGKLNDLKGKEYKWRKPCDKLYYSMILAGDTLFMGGDGIIEAVNVTNGDQIWKAEIAGKVYSLAAVKDHLFASTDKGIVKCFGTKAPSAVPPADGRTEETRQVKLSNDPSVYTSGEFAKTCSSAAKHIVEETGVNKGYGLVLGIENGCLAYKLSEITNLNIVCIEEDIEKVDKARKYLDEAGVYGVRVSVHHGSLDDMPYTDYFANLIVSEKMLMDGELSGSASEVYRVLRPYGGFAYLGFSGDGKISKSMLEEWMKGHSVPGWRIIEGDGLWAVMQKGALPNSGEWTHLYADPGNTACSGDGIIYGETKIQWFGDPGPEPMLDRHHRASVPLFKNGRLFIPADDRFIAVDAYNGTIIWDVEVPKSRRVGANRDSSNMVVTDDYLYVTAQDECWALDVTTGEHKLTFKVPQIITGGDHHWGYTAVVDDLLFGSGRKKDAIYNETSRSADHELAWGDFKRMITSQYIFCMDRHSGEMLWSYQSGVIVNPAITIGDGRIYFLESHNPEAFSDEDGKIQLWTLLGDKKTDMVAIDLHSGKVDWKKQYDMSFSQHQVYLSYADNVLLVTGSKNKDNNSHYYMQAYNADDGSLLWKQDHRNNVPGVGGDHGEQVHHPAIVGDVIYSEPVAYNLKTGDRVNTDGNEGDWEMPRRKGCGTVSASSYCLFYRDHQPSMYELRPNGGLIKLNNVTRTGCWINVIPAGGLVLIPEASSGCTCSYPLQTSMAFIPSNGK